MKINSLHLKNIRSYENAIIDFSEGITLFEGDIGSGKSTILMAIEFALFGLGSEKGAALLRIGATKGHVLLEFQVDGSQFTAYRSLSKRKNAIQQDKCFINIDGTEFKLSPTEMKERILQILNFNEPANSRAKSVIYRYAVFTPQEEMKAIIQMSPDQRLQTLRKALRIEDYKIAMSNAINVARVIDRKSVELTSKASNLNSNQDELILKVQELDKNLFKIKELSDECQKIREELDGLKIQIKRHQEEKNRLSEAKGKVPLVEDQIRNNNQMIKKLQDENQSALKQINENYNPQIEQFNEFELPTDKEEAELIVLLEKLRNAEKYLNTRKATIEAKIDDYKAIENNNVCPTCDRPLDSVEIKLKLKPLLSELQELQSKLEECENGIKETDTLQVNLRKYHEFQKDISTLENQIKEKEGLITRNEDSIQGLREQVIHDEKSLVELINEIDEGKKISEEIEKFESQKEKVENKLSDLNGEISSKKTAVKLLNDLIQDLKARIKKEKSFKEKGEKLQEYHIWIKEFFIPSLENIENQVMLSINLEFNQHFQRWFSILVDDPDKTALINEDFTPIVEQDGYEQEIDYLSGGEKTSIALAYRLALNSIVQRVSTGIKSDVLILDEPTDGFSKEQLFKLREILEELECPQIIIVSHEKELESFADQIFRIEKVDGISKISS
ncbi:SMC family ATPase [Methanobacterium sp. CWC-01]|uniref:AAA family ATPase n=1 Tax=Methanobacterium aridiramus TaxID=2584467 RepID=UPI00257642D5|nr:SMC family ATPase [Methanobacterium sp. CWC-01]WJI08968.1 SMC family ATPase [Methanobacterium sp. CWC-01]